MALSIQDIGIGFYFPPNWEMLVYNRNFPKKGKRRVSWRIRPEPQLLLRKLGKLDDQ